MIQLLLNGALLTLGLMFFLWLLSLMLRNASIADIAWGPFMGLLAAYYVWENRIWDAPMLITLAATALWGLRLGFHILMRNAGKGEDYRYAQWRNEYGAVWPLRSLFQVFLLQGLILWILSWPLGRASHSQSDVTWPIWGAGMALFTVGFLWESVADFQLTLFKKDPANRGKLLTTGLWRYSRHPNYFGEAVVWWGLTLASLGIGTFDVQSLWVLVSPFMMTFLLLKVSGVAMLERGLAKTKPGFEEYMKSTNAFIPGRPRR
ncbi:MAG: DUF1295 domain-containing protein [Spirochaetia bacterium]|nr:DUF1295 domain-containing protein [Spirochaetia bacterium]